MVFQNTVKQDIVDPSYQNENFRARHHFKEAHVHDPPYRRNRDFKPVNYGSFRGILNYKRAEPFESLKNLKDVVNEHHHHPIKWAKTFLFGASAGAFIGYAWFVVRPFQSFPVRKLLQAAGDRPWSGRYLRWARNVIAPYMLIGGSLTLSYQLIFDYLRHHEESNNDRPLVVDHTIAVTLIGATSVGLWGGLPRYWLTGAIFGLLLVSPMSWWMYRHGRLNAANRHANIFYENGVTQEEVDRIRHQDMIESLGVTMQSTPGYGYFKHVGDQRHV
jgi:hypothetical protein